MIDESKMYVVIGVLLIILLGLFVYLICMDLKLRRLEKMSRKTDKDQAETGQSLHKYKGV
jgi:hypothetical protein